MVDAGASTEALRSVLLHYGIGYSPAGDSADTDGAHTVLARITDDASADRLLEGHAGAAALLALDTLEDLADPQRALTSLSTWALAHDEPYLVVSVPNVTHFDLGMGLLCGQWGPAKSGLLDATHLRYYTEESLERLLRNCGWAIADRHDFHAVKSDRYNADLLDGLPEEMVGALRILSQHTNPNWAVEQFVWALTPVRVEQPPQSFRDAMTPTFGNATEGSEGTRGAPREAVVAVQRYLESMGILANETRRRNSAVGGPARPAWQRAMSKAINSSPRTASAYRSVRRRIG